MEFIIRAKNTIFVCDAPARAYIKCIKYHSGYNSCERCTQNGEWEGRVVFPYQKCSVRTNETFANRTDPCHHNGISPLETYLGIGLVSQFVMEPMHLVYLGFGRKFVRLLTKDSNFSRLPVRERNHLSSELVALKPYIPVEFARKPRDLHEIDRWKATECRQFLLYTSILWS